MEKTIIVTGKTIEQALEAALTQLGLTRDDISYEVLSLPKAGFLGFAAQPAKVQVTYEAPDPVVVPEKPKSALGSASRSKPKAKPPVEKKAEPAKAPEAPKAEPVKAEAPKAEKPKAPKTEKKVEKTDAEKVATEAENLTFQSSIANNGEYALAQTGANYSDVKITWKSDNAAAVVTGDKLVVTLPKADEVVKLTATLTCGKETATKTIEVKLENGVITAQLPKTELALIVLENL